ncbi:MFS transporter [Rhodococcus sp. (in: high G+C Gram-positive bacteria)]|uniref:MFS transporter n=1 Tax=Rhodococcus sp. TaxID=1831 RepID=UPI002580146A|nr:MFS transporter [Rhodococcus sp. (in: high G+C Gram-positive bacteria)]MBQ7805080.1 MFS transporter [Rhodococcus sp. (in: high G+C Gram-positive bacteria)]
MPTTPKHSDVERDRIRWLTIAAGFFAVLVDGFDTASLSATVPALAKEWGLPAADFTLPLVLTNVGVVLGYMSAGALSARFAQRKVLFAGVAGTAIFSLLSAATLLTHSILVLAGARLATGLAIGIVLPVAVSLTASLNPERARQRISVGVTLGLAAGLTLGGVFGRFLIESVGTGGMFWAGGLAAIPTAVLVAVAMKGDVRRLGVDAAASAKVARLFDGNSRTRTIYLWCFSFLIFIAAYTLTSWTPTLLVEFGFNATEAPIGLAFMSFGGIIGGLLLLPLTARIGIARALAVMPILGIVCAVAIGITEPGRILVLLLLMGAGAGITSGQIGQLTMAVSLYPDGTRTTGVGWSAAIGRIGSIVGPSIAGVLISLSVSGQNIVLLLAAIPVLVAVICAARLASLQTAATAEAASPTSRVAPSA